MRMLGFLVLLAMTAGCQSGDDFNRLRPAVDLSPLGCGYKWFQSGHAMLTCAEYQATERDRLVELARADAWQIAKTRCPDTCPPIELEDPVADDGPSSQAGCRGGIAYFPSRVFFQCGPGNRASAIDHSVRRPSY